MNEDQKTTTPPAAQGAARRKSIYEAIPDIMSELEAIGRNQRNKEQNFMYRGIDDLYNALQPLMAKHGVFTVPEVLTVERKDRTSRNGAQGIHVFMRIRYTFYGSDGSSVAAVLEGEGLDYGDKGSNKAESVAHKYALTQVFAVRTADQQDPDGDSPQIGKAPKERPQTARPARQAAPQQAQRKGGGQVDPQRNSGQRSANRAASGPPQQSTDPKWWGEPATQPQVKRMFALAKDAGYQDEAQLKSLLFEMFGDAVVRDDGSDVTTTKLTKGMMEKIFTRLESEAPGEKR